jgi:hypothetical protein
MHCPPYLQTSPKKVTSIGVRKSTYVHYFQVSVKTFFIYNMAIGTMDVGSEGMIWEFPDLIATAHKWFLMLQTI